MNSFRELIESNSNQRKKCHRIMRECESNEEDIKDVFLYFTSTISKTQNDYFPINPFYSIYIYKGINYV